MKKIISILLVVMIFLCISCTSTTKIKEQKAPDEHFLADIDSFEIGSINCFAAFGVSSAKITEVFFLCNPRTNEIDIHFKLGIDVVSVSFNYAERQKITTSFDEYLSAIQDTSLENRKPSKKNAFFSSKTFVAWGITGLSHSVDAAEYFTNYEFIEENKPYYKLQLLSAEEKGKDDVRSPYCAIYLTPAQIRTIKELCSQDAIQEEVDRVLAEAYTFDSVEYFFEVDLTEE